MSDATVDALYSHTRAATTKPHLVAVIEPAGETFGVDVVAGMTAGEMEAVATSILSQLVQRAAEHSNACARCAERHDRLTAALAVLGAAPTNPVTH